MKMNHYTKAIEWGKKNGLRFMLAIPDALGIVCTRKGAPEEKIVIAITGYGVEGADVDAIRKWAARWYNSLYYGMRKAKGAILDFKANGDAVLTEAKEFKKNFRWTAEDFAID